MEEKTIKRSSLLIAEKITINGVVNVLTIQDKAVELQLTDKRLYLAGSGFTPLHLDLDKNLLVLSGEVQLVKYSGGAQENFLKRVFK